MDRLHETTRVDPGSIRPQTGRDASESRVISKRSSTTAIKAELETRPLDLAIGLEIEQRDNPKVDWQISRLHGDMVLLLDPKPRHCQ